MIEKPSIIVTSLGRTGTEFFARLFADLVPDSTSLHEPDIFQNTGVRNKYGHYLSQLGRAGLWRMLVLKAIGKWTLVNVSDSRYLGRLDSRKALYALQSQRRTFVRDMPGGVYIEANIGYYGLLDILPEAFRDHRVVYFVRDGREWVRSHMNWGEAYGKRGLRKLISHNWPDASRLPGDPYAEEWEHFSRFEKLCWAWARLNEFAMENLSKNPQARLFYFEEIFMGERRYEALNELVAFATSLPDINKARLGSTAGWLEKRIHQSSEGFPAWEGWSQDQKTKFARICGPLMEKLGYQIG